jgi:hypothetical protein
VVTIDQAHRESIDGETNGDHTEDRYGCAISHHDKLNGDRNVRYEVTLLSKINDMLLHSLRYRDVWWRSDVAELTLQWIDTSMG